MENSEVKSKNVEVKSKKKKNNVIANGPGLSQIMFVVSFKPSERWQKPLLAERL